MFMIEVAMWSVDNSERGNWRVLTIIYSSLSSTIKDRNFES